LLYFLHNQFGIVAFCIKRWWCTPKIMSSSPLSIQNIALNTTKYTSTRSLISQFFNHMQYLSNRHAEWHFNCSILCVKSTRMHVISTRMRLQAIALTRMRVLSTRNIFSITRRRVKSNQHAFRPFILSFVKTFSCIWCICLRKV
jgi:hypothetical protein